MPNNPPAGDPDPPRDPPNPFAASQLDAPAAEEPLAINPWRSIVTRPRETIRQLVEHNPAHRVYLLVGLAAFVGVMGVNDGPDSRHYPLGFVVLLALTAGPAPFAVVFYVGSVMMRWLTRLLGGAATPAETRAAIAWSVVPVLYSSPVVALSAVANSAELCRQAAPWLPAIDFLTRLTSAAVAVSSGAIAVATLSEVNRFSRLRAAVAIMLAVLVLVPLAFAAGVAWVVVFGVPGR